MDPVRALLGLWLYAHDRADEFFRETVASARHTRSDERDVVESLFLLAREGERELERLPSELGLATRQDLARLERRLDRLIAALDRECAE